MPVVTSNTDERGSVTAGRQIGTVRHVVAAPPRLAGKPSRGLWRATLRNRTVG